jgi:hypothetical protein
LDAILPGYFRLNETVLRLDEEVRTLRGEMPEVQARSHENNRLVHISLDRTNLLYDNYEALQKRVDGVSDDDEEEPWAAAPLADAPTVVDPLPVPPIADAPMAEAPLSNPMAEASLAESMPQLPAADDEKAIEVDENDEPLADASLVEAPLADASLAEVLKSPVAEGLVEAPLQEVLLKSPVAEGSRTNVADAPVAGPTLAEDTVNEVKSPVAEGSRRNVADAPVAAPTLAEDSVNEVKEGDAKEESKDKLPKVPQREEETIPVDTPQTQPSSEMPPPLPPRIPSSVPTVTLIPATPQTSQEEVLKTLLQVPESSTVPSSDEHARRSRSRSPSTDDGQLRRSPRLQSRSPSPSPSSKRKRPADSDIDDRGSKRGREK